MVLSVYFLTEGRVGWRCCRFEETRKWVKSTTGKKERKSIQEVQRAAWERRRLLASAGAHSGGGE